MIANKDASESEGAEKGVGGGDSERTSANKVEKEKAGFYLRKELIDELELVWVQARSITGNRISKSDIVNFALKNLIEEFQENPEDHKLIHKWNN